MNFFKLFCKVLNTLIVFRFSIHIYRGNITL